MIVSETPVRMNSLRLKWLVLLFAVVVLPLGAARAEDDKAKADARLQQVQARLKAAVAAGDMSAEDARAKLRAIKAAKTSDGKKEIDYDAIGKRIKAAVAAGQLTEAEAKAKWAAIKGEAKDCDEKDKVDAYLTQVWAKLQAAVKEGKMSAKDAEAKMGAIKRAKLGDGKKDIDYEAIGKKIRAAVAAGKLTEAEAKAKWAAIKGATDAKKGHGAERARKYLSDVKDKLGALVEAGKMSEEDAKKRYQAAEKAIKARMAAARGEVRSRTVTREDYRRAETQLRKLVAEGKMSAEAARARLGAMRERIGQQKEGAAKKDVDWGNIKKRIEGAVQRGDMTREQAGAKYREIRERMAGQRD